MLAIYKKELKYYFTSMMGYVFIALFLLAVGFFSAFNSDMVADVELYKSSIPSQYGGRISSVLNITGKEANKEKFEGVAGIGLLTSKLNLEIPLWKQRTSLLLSGRTTYSDWILGMLCFGQGAAQ